MKVQIPITLCSDAKGYLDRECPNPNCQYTFKIKLDDWKTKVSDDEVHCPMCGYMTTSDKWWTQEQLAAQKKIARDWALNYVQGMLANSLKKVARSSHGAITYKPGRRTPFRNPPIKQREEWENEITCEKCGTQYSVIGAAYFCPCCGHNSVERTFEDSLERIGKMLDSIPVMRQALESTSDRDDAESICRAFVERSLGEIVSAFQKFACSKYENLSGSAAKVNDFQMVDKGSAMFKALCGRDYSAWLSQDELADMALLFQRRHILEHNAGIVDQKYLDKTQDKDYIVGQRIVVRQDDARRLLAIIQKLSSEIRKVV